MIEKVHAPVSNKENGNNSPDRRPLASFNHSQSQTPDAAVKILQSSLGTTAGLCDDEGAKLQRTETTASPLQGGSSPILRENGSILGQSSYFMGKNSPRLGTDGPIISTSNPHMGRNSPSFDVAGQSAERSSPILGVYTPVSKGNISTLLTTTPNSGKGSPILNGNSMISNSCSVGKTEERGGKLCPKKAEDRLSVRDTIDNIESRNAKNVGKIYQTDSKLHRDSNHNVRLPNGQVGSEAVSPRICSMLPTSSILPKQLILGVPACRVQALPSRKPTPPKRDFNFPSLAVKQAPRVISPGKDVFEFSDGGGDEPHSDPESDEDIFALTSKVKENVERLSREADEDSFSPNLPALEEPAAPSQRSGTSKKSSVPKVNGKIHNTRRNSIPLAGVKSALSKSTLNKSLNSRKRKSDGVLPSAKRTNSDVDVCSAAKCLRPTGKMIPWVQCDDCDKWYHTRCHGCDFEEVRKSTADFHCGCV